MGNSQDFLTRLAATDLLPTATMTKLQASPRLGRLDAKQLAEELIRRKLISVYQARALLTQRTPKFHYGSYRIVGRQTAGFAAGLLEAIHRPTKHLVEIDLVDVPDKTEVEQHCHVRHPNLIDCYEVVRQDGPSCVVLERVQGSSLAEVIQERSLSTKMACRIVQQVASACWALHAAGLVHGLICPASIVVVSPAQVRLLRRPGRHRQHTATDKVAELLNNLTDETTAPEWHVDHERNCEMDVYSLGRLLQLLLTNTDDPISRLIESLVAKPPEQRLRHAGAVAAALTAFSGAVAKSTDPGTDLETDPTPNEPVIQYAEYLKTRRADQVDPSVGNASSLQFTTEEKSQTDLLHSRRRSARHKQLILGIVAGLLFVVGGLFVAQRFTSNDAALPNATLTKDATAIGDPPDSHTAQSNLGPSADPRPTDRDPTSDDGQSLWASPTNGAAIELRYVPAGTQLILLIRPSMILADPEGRRSLKALGPAFRARRQAWEQEFGASLEQVNELRASVVPRDGDPPDICWRVDLVDGVECPAKWSDGRRVTVGDQILHVLGDRAVWRSPEKSVIFGNEATVREVIENRDSVPVLRRELEQLRAESDRDQLLTLLFTPNFVANEGKKITAPQTHPILNAIFDLFGDGTRGCLASLHLDDEQLYGEVRLAGTGERGPVQQARQLREAAARIPLKMESAISQAAALDLYWRRLALRAVRMMDFAAEHTRTDVEGRTVVANVSLPPHAAHNLLLAIELTTASSYLAGEPEATAADTPARPMTFDDILATKISLDIPQQSIEFALRDLAADLNAQLGERAPQVVIRIDGGSLQAEGITRNQQIRGFRRDATVADLLTGLVMVANPVTTVQTPDEPDQKLVWVVVSSSEPPSGAERIILITTRKAANQNGYSLPAAFQAK